MVSFSCDGCGDIIKKAKVKQHLGGRCRGASVSCIDCHKVFQGNQYDTHNSCISEAEKYQGALYRPNKKAKNQQPQKNQNNNNQQNANNSNSTTNNKQEKGTANGVEKEKEEVSNNGNSKTDNKKRKLEDTNQQAEQATTTAPDENPSYLLLTPTKLKWKKAVKRTLKGNKNGMNVDTFKSKLLETFLEKVKSQLESQIEEKLAISNILKVENSTVTLA